MLNEHLCFRQIKKYFYKVTFKHEVLEPYTPTKNKKGKQLKLSGLGVWNLYFLVKFALFYYGAISFDFLSNTAFAAFLAVHFKNVRIEKLKHLSAVMLGVILLYKDSWLPPINRLVKQADNIQDFNASYFVELVGRVINVDMLLGLFIIIVFSGIAHNGSDLRL